MSKTHITVKFPFPPPSTAELERLLRAYDGGALTDVPIFYRHKAGYRLDANLLAKKMLLAGVGTQRSRASFLRALVVTAQRATVAAKSGAPLRPAIACAQPQLSGQHRASAFPDTRSSERRELDYYEAKAALEPFSVAPQPGNRYVLQGRQVLRFEPGAADPIQVWELPV